MKNLMKPARIHALLVMLAGLAVAYLESGKLGLALAVLGLLGGETVQRVEDSKTLNALLTPLDEDH
ncbi:hypothetical protein ACWDTQ_26630 [Streptomyces cellulosae]